SLDPEFPWFRPDIGGANRSRGAAASFAGVARNAVLDCAKHDMSSDGARLGPVHVLRPGEPAAGSIAFQRRVDALGPGVYAAGQAGDPGEAKFRQCPRGFQRSRALVADA